MEYTTVIGVDAKHLKHLELTWPTWVKHKPDIMQNPMVVFFDESQVQFQQISEIIKEGREADTTYVPWPQDSEANFEPTEPETKWNRGQRYKMLAGFVHVPAYHVHTRYWLKLDLDSVATGVPDWVDPDWFNDSPDIVSHPWGFTKPANQMVLLDEWFDSRFPDGPHSYCERLNIIPQEGAGRVSHRRIISWCGFFSTSLSQVCSESADYPYLPVPSQDGYMWYMAKRLGGTVRRINMKKLGWKHRSSIQGIKHAVEESSHP